jgi:hypothetical protein
MGNGREMSSMEIEQAHQTLLRSRGSSSFARLYVYSCDGLSIRIMGNECKMSSIKSKKYQSHVQITFYAAFGLRTNAHSCFITPAYLCTKEASFQAKSHEVSAAWLRQRGKKFELSSGRWKYGARCSCCICIRAVVEVENGSHGEGDGVALVQVRWLRSVGWFDVLYVNRMSKRGQKTDPQKWELKNED